MRITLDYEITPDVIPKNNGRAFISLIKKLIQETDPLLFNDYYNQHKLKPFTFGTYFPQLQGNENDKLKVGNIVKLNFSTSSIQLATNIYNGFIKTPEHFWRNNGSSITFKPLKAFLNKQTIITKSEHWFKTLSPFLISNKGESNEFLLPSEDGFIEGLQFSLNECAKEFLGIDEKVEFEFEQINMKRHVIYHYKKMPTNKGVFRMKAEPAILQMIYDIGIGVHRSQGFGMLEVVG
ncbi:MAG: CRISPR-associated endoribonuclease Cas6 [Stygiobacter sp.]